MTEETNEPYVKVTRDGQLEPTVQGEISSFALRSMYGHLVDAIIHDKDDAIDWSRLEAPELVIAVRTLRDEAEWLKTGLKKALEAGYAEYLKTPGIHTADFEQWQKQALHTDTRESEL